MKRIFPLLCLILLCLLVLPQTATEVRAATVESGSCGTAVTWTYTDDGMLTIRGSGSMFGYTNGETPWHAYRRSIRTVIIENGVTGIGTGAFSYCNAIETVSIPDSVQKVGERAFLGCSNLRTVTLPEGIPSLPDLVFRDCTSLNSVVIPHSVTTLGMGLFDGCSSLVSLHIPEGITKIPYTFARDCSSLEFLQLPRTLTAIDSCAFNGAYNLTDIYYTGTEAEFQQVHVLSHQNDPFFRAAMHYSAKAPCINHAFRELESISEALHSGLCVLCGTPQTSPHRWDSGAVTQEAACDHEGEFTYTCLDCHAKKTAPIPKADHRYDSICDANCNICGQERVVTHTYGSAWSGNETHHFRLCVICDAPSLPETHVPGPEATATTPQICTVCHRTLVAANGAHTEPPTTLPPKGTEPPSDTSDSSTADLPKESAATTDTPSTVTPNRSSGVPWWLLIVIVGIFIILLLLVIGIKNEQAASARTDNRSSRQAPSSSRTTPPTARTAPPPSPPPVSGTRCMICGKKNIPTVSVESVIAGKTITRTACEDCAAKLKNTRR
ncbi:MAG: leucine-rich repeat domain-containing protein [Ruminococcaceae bacterium]|nr:leucine-rich repeat domain-containing protein [Oscillospiraceae bacterium]